MSLDIFKRKKDREDDVVSKEATQKFELTRDDVAIILRVNGKCETVCSLKGKHTLTPQEEVIMGLGGLLQHEKFVASIREHFMISMQNMLSSKYVEDMQDVDDED